MTQRTAKRLVEALYWIHNNAHHEVGTEYHPTKCDDEGRALKTHMFFRNHHDTSRVPVAMLPELFKLIRPNKRAFDTRMYALTRKGRLMVTR